MDEIRLKKSLKKVTIAFAVISVLIIIFGMFASVSLDRVFKQTIHKQVVNQIHEYKTNMENRINSEFQTLYTLASLLEFSENITVEQLSKGLYESNSQTNFLRMIYFNGKGDGIRVIVDKDIENNIDISDIEISAQSVVSLAYEGEKAISDVYYDVMLKRYVITYAIPVQRNGKVNGVLTATEDVKKISDVLNNGSILSENGIVALVNSSGKILVGSENVMDLGIRHVRDLKNMTIEAKDKLMSYIANKQRGFVSFGMNGYDWFAKSEPMGFRDWSIVVADSAIGANDPIYNSIIMTRITSILPLILAIVCILYGCKYVRNNSYELLKLAYYDTVTGAYNMEKFVRLLENAWNEERVGAVIALNIRQFKFINELFGVEQANRLLCHMKSTIGENISYGEFFCRDSADAFYIFMNKSDRENISKRVENIINKIGDMVLNQNQKYPIMLYCGVAFTDECISEKKTITELMTRVMFALNRAKATAKNSNIVFYDLELHETERLQNYIESHMEQALKDDEFKLFLQPQFDLKTGKLHGAEALVRWITNEGKMIFPDQFIPLFEENGFCTRLDIYMVEKACMQLRKWIDMGYEPINISVNQSKLLFYEDDYVYKLCEITRRYGIDEKYITIEILEGLALNNVSQLNLRINQLKEIGFKVSMDDFGSGYSSLNTLGNLDIDELKLDRAFLLAASQEGGHRQRLIMEQIITLAQKMNIRTVTEGVETKENEEMITNLGCDYGQGYYYSRPISENDFTEKYIINRK